MTKVMSRSEESGTLVAFTALAPLAVGGLVGLLVARGSSDVARDRPGSHAGFSGRRPGAGDLRVPSWQAMAGTSGAAAPC